MGRERGGERSFGDWQKWRREGSVGFLGGRLIRGDCARKERKGRRALDGLLRGFWRLVERSRRTRRD